MHKYEKKHIKTKKKMTLAVVTKIINILAITIILTLLNMLYVTFILQNDQHIDSLTSFRSCAFLFSSKLESVL